MPRKIKPLTEQQKQFQDIIQPQLEKITIEQVPLNTITPERLRKVLLEKDIDDILCWKGDYSSDMQIDAKVEKVHEIFSDIVTGDSQPSAMDALIKQLIEQSIVYDLRNEKRKELTLAFQRAFNGLVTKEDITKTREQIKSSKSFDGVKADSEVAASARRRAKKKSRDEAKIKDAEDALDEFNKEIADSKSSIQLADLESLLDNCQKLIQTVKNLNQKQLNNSVVSKKQAEAAKEGLKQSQSVPV
jgi:hypothetical protein